MKKRSFFERLSSSFRFEDTPLEVHESLPKKEDLPKASPLLQKEDQTHASPQSMAENEVGELPIDMYETEHEIIINAIIGGVLSENLTLSITRDTVTIEGKRENNKSIQDNQYHFRELFWGSFARSVTLPEEIEIDAAEAIERHGMLLIKLPKLDKARKAQLKIKSI
jgi:HSP20 family protein